MSEEAKKRIKEINKTYIMKIIFGIVFVLLGLMFAFYKVLKNKSMPDSLMEVFEHNTSLFILGSIFILFGLLIIIFYIISLFSKPKEVVLFLEDSTEINVTIDENGKEKEEVNEDIPLCFSSQEGKGYFYYGDKKYEKGKFYNVLVKGEELVEVRDQTYNMIKND